MQEFTIDLDASHIMDPDERQQYEAYQIVQQLQKLQIPEEQKKAIFKMLMMQVVGDKKENP